MATIFDRYKERLDKEIEEQSGGKPAAAPPQPPPGSRTLSKGVPPTEAEKKASNEALVRMLRDRRF